MIMKYILIYYFDRFKYHFKNYRFINLLTTNDHKILEVPENVNGANNEPIYNHGQEAVSTANNERSTLQNIDDGVLQQLVQALSQEVSLRQQNNGQASNSNIARNNN